MHDFKAKKRNINKSLNGNGNFLTYTNILTQIVSFPRLHAFRYILEIFGKDNKLF